LGNREISIQIGEILTCVRNSFSAMCFRISNFFLAEKVSFSSENSAYLDDWSVNIKSSRLILSNWLRVWFLFRVTESLPLMVRTPE
jgi:hypothetical protein